MTAAVLRAGDLLRGERGREYRILEWRGEGSFSRVYRAAGQGRGPAPVAVKLAKAEICGAVERLERERAVRARLRHPRLVALLDRGRWEDAPFLVLEWIGGEDLRRSVERRRGLPLATALGYWQDVTGAVAALHAAGFAHGDLRPENVLLAENTPHASLSDLGETTDRRDPDHSAHVAADVCALGVLLAFMLTGEREDRALAHLTTANGYNPRAVTLGREAAAGRFTAAALHKEIGALLRAIGAARRP